MLELVKKHPRYAIGAVLVHVFFLALFVVTFHFHTSERAATTQRVDTVKVTTVDQKLVQKELHKFKAEDARERQRREELIKQRKAEQKRLAELQAKRQAEQKKEQQRIALAKQKAELLKQKQEAARKRKLQKEAAERKRRQELKRQIQAQNDKALKQQLAAEAKQMQRQQQIEAQRKAALKAKQDEISKYMNAIENKIYQNWVAPPDVKKGLVCELQVTLIPTGDVVNIEVSKSSGDPVYDQSVIAAVKRASPLPVPPAGDGLFDEFRNVTLSLRSDKKL